MKRLTPLGIILVLAAGAVIGAPPRFEKVSDHYYCFQCRSGGLNVGAVVSDDGVLLINPPPEPDLTEAMDALKRVSPRPVRWIVATDYRIAVAGGAGRLAEQGAVLIGSDSMRPLLAAPYDPKTTPDGQQETKAGPPAPRRDIPRLSIAFGSQMRLFPGGLEVRIFSLHAKARTAGDVVILIPAEKIVQLGDLYNLGSYPEIDEDEGGGSATGWIDGMKQVIESVPLLKPAIPAPKTSPSAKAAPPKTVPAVGGDKTLEEEVIVVTGHGPRSNLMELKGLLETSQKLRAEVSKLASGGTERENVLSSPRLAAFRVYNGFDQYASQLFDELSKK